MKSTDLQSGSLQGAVRRSKRKEDPQETKWWVVEWRNPRWFESKDWKPEERKRPSLENALDWIRRIVKTAGDQWRVVEVVERRTTVHTWKRGSPNVGDERLRERE